MSGRSWKTTLCSVGKALSILGAALAAHFDADPETAAGWGVAVFAVFELVGGHFSRDRDVSSEAEGLSA